MIAIQRKTFDASKPILQRNIGARGLLRPPSIWSRRVFPLSIIGPADDGESETARGSSGADDHPCIRVLERTGWENPETLNRARDAIAVLIESRVGGDCWAKPAPIYIRRDDGCGRVLIVAPDSGDALARMASAVDAEHAGDAVTLLIPEDCPKIVRRRCSAIAVRRNWTVLAGPVDPWSLLHHAPTVFTTGHEIGFLALLKGLKVRCFGNAYYAGWGVTADDATVPDRAMRRGIVEIFAASCLIATTYKNPYTGASCTFEDIQTILSQWRRVNEANLGLAACVGMSIWKRRRMADLLRSTGGGPKFGGVPAAIAAARKSGGSVAVWAAREPAGLAAAATAAGVKVIRIEDGFVRSVGLGADFMPAASIVVDITGIYFDPGKPSDLDAILLETAFDAPLLRRSACLIHRLIAQGITKYNVGGAMPKLDIPAGARRLFVPGQVENDRSVTLGGAGIYSNIDLLRRVRALNPDAFIVYKPHPDVDAGHRTGALPDTEVLRYADRVVRGACSAAIIAAMDEVHTLTSLAGFEALIRRRRVVAYGQPFYAGWGLTTDLAPIAHRGRSLSLEELVAGVLILYPRYLDPVTRLPCGVETVIDRMSQPEHWRPGPLTRLRRLQGAWHRRRTPVAPLAASR